MKYIKKIRCPLEGRFKITGPGVSFLHVNECHEVYYVEDSEVPVCTNSYVVICGDIPYDKREEVKEISFPDVCKLVGTFRTSPGINGGAVLTYFVFQEW